LDAAGRVVALIEMPAETFEQACEDGTLETAIDEARDAFRKVPMPEARARATRALDHFAKAGGATNVGEAVRLLMRIVMQAHQQTVMAMTPSAFSSLIGSAPSTGDSPAAASSTTSATPTP
jgi:hypothetical protein